MENKKQNLPILLDKRSFDIDIVNDRENAMALFANICKNKNISVNSPEEAMVLYMKARELGIGFASALDHMHVIRGKTGIDIHIVKAILLKAGRIIKWEKTKDYLPHYKYSDGSVFIDDKGNKIPKTFWISPLKPNEFIKWLENEDPYYKGCVYAPGAEFTKIKAEGGTPICCISPDGKLTPHDYVTEYTFTREQIFGTTNEVVRRTEVSSFSMSEAYQSGKYKPDEKDSAWVCYPKIMLDHRAFTFGARAIADDLLLGAYETKELYEMTNVDYIMDADGKVIAKTQFTETSPPIPNADLKVTPSEDVTDNQV